MPELPEVETMRRGILSIVGAKVADVAKPPCARRPILLAPGIAAFRRRTVGRSITAIDRVGKRVIIVLEGGDRIVLEPRMTGLVLVADPPTREHLRWVMTLENSPVEKVWYWDRRGLGSVRLFSEQEFVAEFTESGKIGPDALSISWEELRDRLTKSRRAVKVALLDQKAVCGVGNLYAAELLHVAKVHPETPCDEISTAAWKKIHAAMVDVLQEAIKYEGSTLGDGTYRNALNQDGGYQNCHRVYGREGELCRTCGKKEVIRIVQAQRATFFCERCQKAKL
ncbi:bifunctional DNA-formamidopyrimidine glycosylase/DNA-(apurinic or apyrimidinic site) lyase [Blastopirellula sp. JC732]|uniref:Formamidopyrimidine-DNA glycosylase n=1 Tax=Blastopirellula sediminis TaxID=2894196 RepID=A0A9X1MQ49_9BACT|nr:bifunctional DNA-formamidopyrimidine glycosylase/DNA-(apurinic or apyrimidinic site) lyase [Blastopirellula sediminis]MCC9605987.1 bifunctional DNA-formamidopyrimidine glycosylase/DNA-(apurinic or apyrimidinic site) lyase [Blastopirellula sediminis]MCC9630714.1 bifunctional DNA-formamidopyrimidine glycosylase/DNA-(apurinic or apyrimidinic site) lyase [Blastopirellula sediminis]